MADIFEIAGRIHSTSQEHVISPADEILDTSQNKKQHLINSDVARHESEINSPTNGLNKRVADIEALGQIGDTPVETNASNIINNTSLNGKVPSASAVNGVYNAVVANAGYYTCDSEASTAAKVVETSGYVLTVGGCIKIKMTNANTADDDATLNINSTGAKALYYEGERASATNSWEEGETVEVYYDGTNFYANNVAGSGGDGVFDVSEKYPTSGVEGGNTYTLEGALAVLNANLSASKKKGGMSIKFIQSTNNKYVSFRLTADEFTTDTTQWAIADEGVYVENPEFVYVKTDKDDKILWAIKIDGDIFYGAGVPSQVVEYVTTQINAIKSGTDSTNIDGINKIIAFLDDFSTSDTLKALLDKKVDKETGKSLIQELVAENVRFLDSPEFMSVETDSENKILSGRKTDGTKFENMPIETPSVRVESVDNPEWIDVKTDNEGHILEGYDKQGEKIFGKIPAQITKEIKSQIENNQKTLNLLYRDESINKIILDLNNKISGNDIVFAHVTDTHSGRSTLPLNVSADFMNVASYISSLAGASFLCHTGDAIDGYAASSKPAKESYDALFSFVGQYPMPVLFAEGNYVHDFGYQGELNRKEVQTLANRYKKWLSSEVVYNSNDTVKSYFYFDDVIGNCRIFILDAQDYGDNRRSYGFSSNQVDFVSAALSDALQANKSVIFFAHMPPLAGLFIGSDYGMGTNGEAMLNAISSFTSNGGKVLAYVYGHMHADNYYYDVTNKIPFICLTCGAVENNLNGSFANLGYSERPIRNIDTIDKYAIDIYVINSETGKIHILRYGAGSSRIINVNTTEVQVGSSANLVTEIAGDIEWFIDDSEVATINNGTVTGVAQGSTWAMAKKDGEVEFYNINVI